MNSLSPTVVAHGPAATVAAPDLAGIVAAVTSSTYMSLNEDERLHWRHEHLVRATQFRQEQLVAEAMADGVFHMVGLSKAETARLTRDRRIADEGGAWRTATPRLHVVDAPGTPEVPGARDVLRHRADTEQQFLSAMMLLGRLDGVEWL